MLICSTFWIWENKAITRFFEIDPCMTYSLIVHSEVCSRNERLLIIYSYLQDYSCIYLSGKIKVCWTKFILRTKFHFISQGSSIRWAVLELRFAFDQDSLTSHRNVSQKVHLQFIFVQSVPKVLPVRWIWNLNFIFMN